MNYDNVSKYLDHCYHPVNVAMITLRLLFPSPLSLSTCQKLFPYLLKLSLKDNSPIKSSVQADSSTSLLQPHFYLQNTNTCLRLLQWAQYMAISHNKMWAL